MSDLDFSYLDSVEWKRFPRDADGNLKVSQATRERVDAYLTAQEADPMATHLVSIVEERCNSETYTPISAIVLGLDEFTRQRVYCCLSRLHRFYKIIRRGTVGNYSYRLLRVPGEAKILKSATAGRRG